MDFNIFWPTATLQFEKYSIFLIAARIQVQIHIIQPQREGDGRQALVVPPLDPTPATSLAEALLILFDVIPSWNGIWPVCREVTPQ